jgi:hypothetical protein
MTCNFTLFDRDTRNFPYGGTVLPPQMFHAEQVFRFLGAGQIADGFVARGGVMPAFKGRHKVVPRKEQPHKSVPVKSPPSATCGAEPPTNQQL